MKKFLLLFLFWFFGLLFTQITYWTIQSPFPSCRQKIVCSMIINPYSVDWYKFVSVSWFSWSAKEINLFSCTSWFIFLVPENLDVNTIKTIKLEDRTRKTDYIDPYLIKFWSLSIQNNPFHGGKSRFWVDFEWGLENEDTVSIWRFIDESYNLCIHNKPSRVIRLYEFWDNGYWAYDLNLYSSVPIDNSSIIKYLLCFVWSIIVICWIVYFIKRIKAKKAE